MPGSLSPIYAPSAALIALCQSQIRLLQQGLQVDWCGVYLTQGETERLTLLAVSQSPAERPQDKRGLTSAPHRETAIVADEVALSPHRSALSQGGSGGSPLQDAPPFDPDKRLVLPLIYEEEVIGLLVVDRSYPPWQSAELSQLEAIANSLAIACLLDQQQDWYRGAWEQQLQQRRWEQQHWADLLHQLRNPLTALKTFSKLLLRRWQGDEKGQQVVEGIVREGEHLQALMQEFEASQGRRQQALLPGEVALSALPPAPDSSASFPLTDLPLLTVLNPIVVAEQAIAEEKGIQLVNQLPPAFPLVKGNGTALREIFSNLLDNAVKYTPTGGAVYLTQPNPPDHSPHWVGVAIADT
ncbi:MAG: GAF domain-containing sensor histidine kinase, partial [Synechocystis sp.]|nr:GAF domain-containing sensor histidine kinase [Synechocystis sp.]